MKLKEAANSTQDVRSCLDDVESLSINTAVKSNSITRETDASSFDSPRPVIRPNWMNEVAVDYIDDEDSDALASSIYSPDNESDSIDLFQLV